MQAMCSSSGHPFDDICLAALQLERMELYEEDLVELEACLWIQQDTGLRIRGLIGLTQFYHREFGVHFEKRHAYREQLFRVLSGQLSKLDEARRETLDHYGDGLPRLEWLVSLACSGSTYRKSDSSSS